MLSIAIALLVLFNGMQLYRIMSEKPAASAVKPKNDADTAHVPIQINVLNGCGTSGVGTTMTKFCRQAGYDVVEMGNYKSFDVEESMVIDRSGKLNDAKYLASTLGIKPKNVIQQFSNDHMVSASVVIGKDFKNLVPWKK
ncbi:MAG: LytR C-terminal domain-containing protein [Ignavibacteriales bacterium]|nr:LytR C-terminal domain-containing protein [Ignavibacteriales bacterium]